MSTKDDDTEKYPQWAADAYGEMDFEKWAAKKKLGVILSTIGIVIFFGSIVASIVIATNFSKDTPSMLMMSMVTLFLVISGAIIIAGTILYNTGLNRKSAFEQDLSDLQDMLGYTPRCGSIYFYEDVLRDVQNALVGDAVWIRIYELTDSEKLAKLGRREMCDNYNLCMRFGLVQATEVSYILNKLPAKPFFDAANAKVSETLNFALRRFDRQQQ